MSVIQYSSLKKSFVDLCSKNCLHLGKITPTTCSWYVKSFHPLTLHLDLLIANPAVLFFSSLQSLAPDYQLRLITKDIPASKKCEQRDVPLKILPRGSNSLNHCHLSSLSIHHYQHTQLRLVSIAVCI